VLATTVSVTKEGKREILMNEFHANPICRRNSRGTARHAINMVTAVAVRRTAKDVNRKWRGIMIWVARAFAAVTIMMLIYALILRFWPQ
jgi:CO/xanthine dehydrogenase FAD-binding subunit